MINSTDVFLSVVIPCRNEEKNIERCLASVLSATKAVADTEIMVVDSLSKDRTVELAKLFPVSIISLRDGWFLSPSAARYLGCLNTSGKYILILDADMELQPGFIEQALELLEADEMAAGAAGLGDEYYPDGSVLKNMYGRPDKLKEVSLLAGAALFKRSAMLKSGGYFNPFLKAEEEHELCVRLSKAGYKLWSMPQLMLKHYTSKNLDNFRRRLSSGMYRGIGQMFRLTLEQGNFSLQYFKRFKLFHLFLLFFLACLMSVCYFMVTGRVGMMALFAAALLFIWGVSCYSKKGLLPGTQSLYKWVIINAQILRGILDKTSPAGDYPADIIVIKGVEK